MAGSAHHVLVLQVVRRITQLGPVACGSRPLGPGAGIPCLDAEPSAAQLGGADRGVFTVVNGLAGDWGDDLREQLSRRLGARNGDGRG